MWYIDVATPCLVGSECGCRRVECVLLSCACEVMQLSLLPTCVQDVHFETKLFLLGPTAQNLRTATTNAKQETVEVDVVDPFGAVHEGVRRRPNLLDFSHPPPPRARYDGIFFTKCRERPRLATVVLWQEGRLMPLCVSDGKQSGERQNQGQHASCPPTSLSP